MRDWVSHEQCYLKYSTVRNFNHRERGFIKYMINKQFYTSKWLIPIFVISVLIFTLLTVGVMHRIIYTTY